MSRREGRDDDRRVESGSIEQARREKGSDRHGRDRDEDRDRGSVERRERDRQPRYAPIIVEEDESGASNHSNARHDRHTSQQSRGYDYEPPSTRRPPLQTTNSSRRPPNTGQISTPTLPQLSTLPTLLSPLEISFANIKVDDYDACRDFIIDNPRILQQDANLFLREATAAHRNGQYQYARSCAQQALIIRELNDKSSQSRRHFFEDLADLEDPEVLNGFLDQFETTIEAVQRGAGGPAAPAAPRPVVNGPITYSQALGGTPRRTHNDNPLPATAGLSLQSTSDRPRYNPAPLSYVRETMPQVHYDSRHHHRRLVSDPLPRGGVMKGASIREGTPGDRFLDPNYTRRLDAKKFFRVGRIFALLWHEPAGSDGGSATSFRGENVYSNIRRMAVVRANDVHSACWAVPIHTYGNKGVAKRGFNEIDVQGHAVIYMTGTTPYAAPEEPRMSKMPIQVDPAQDKNQELDPKKTRLDLKKIRLEPMSRINFTRVHTVEHEVKVLNIGTVSKKSMPDFERYWAEQVQTQTRPLQSAREV